MSREINGYTTWEFAHEGANFQIYSAGIGPSVIVLHELPGLTTACLELGLVLAKAVPARVHLPLLFGPPQPTSLEKLKNVARVCISKEIYLFASNRTSPIVSWCRALCNKLQSNEPANSGVGVVGMCLTGGFALALIANKSVRAAVVAQPSLPLFVYRSSLGLSDRDVTAIAQTSALHSSRCVLGLRHQFDILCPSRRMRKISRLLGPAFGQVVIPGYGHSTLTARENGEALKGTISFLSERLRKREGKRV